MGKLYDVVAFGEEYTDGQGNKKREFINIGAVIEGKNGPFLKLKAIPTNWDGMAALYEPKDNRSRGANRNAQGGNRGYGGGRGGYQQEDRGNVRSAPRGGSSNPEDMDDDIPF